DRPRSETAAKVRAHWVELTAPKVSTVRGAEVMGLPSPEGEGTCLGRDGGRRPPGRNGRPPSGERTPDSRPDGGRWRPGRRARPHRAAPAGGPPAGHPAGWRALVPGLVRPVARTVPWRAIGAGSAVGLLLAVSPRLTQNPDAWFTVQVLRAATVAFAVGLAFL